MADEQQLWERQPWESEASFARFHDHYLSQDRPRSLVQAYRLYYAGRYGLDVGSDRVAQKHAPGQWQYWAQGRDGQGQRRQIKGQPVPTWADRAHAYNDHLAELDRAKWEQRRAAVREQDWDDANQLRDLAHQVLEQAPLFDGRTRVAKGRDGEPDQVVKTVKLNAVLAVQALKLASELQRLAAEMATGVTEHNVTVKTAVTSDDLAQARDQAQAFEEQLLGHGNPDGPGQPE